RRIAGALRGAQPGGEDEGVGRGALARQQVRVDHRAQPRGASAAEGSLGHRGRAAGRGARHRRGSGHGVIVPDGAGRRGSRPHTEGMIHVADPVRTVAVIGAGPRGTAIIERLVAASMLEDWQGPLTVHLIDPHVGRGGAVWRHDQSPVLLMNTTTCQTTMYPDPSCHPTLPVPHTDTLADHLAAEGYAPTDFAPRAAHGRYLAAVLARARADADPARLRIVEHAAEAVDVTGPADGTQRVRLDDGRVLRADAVALALGHLPTALG